MQLYKSEGIEIYNLGGDRHFNTEKGSDRAFQALTRWQAGSRAQLHDHQSAPPPRHQVLLRSPEAPFFRLGYRWIHRRMVARQHSPYQPSSPNLLRFAENEMRLRMH
jgi:hypothetical protein